MALNQILRTFKTKYDGLGIVSWRYFTYVFLAVLFCLLFIIISNLIEKQNNKQTENLSSIVESKEFSSLSNYLISKINSPYKEIQYLIQNNDSIEKILKNFNINANDVKIIGKNLKEKKLSNIYTGRKLSIIIKKLDDGSNTVVNLTYPVSNTLNIEVRKSQNNFIIKENILQLYKNEVVIKNEIKNNLYSAAVNAGIEPNIIIEFARIFGFEVDFQRDIRKGDWFEN